MTSPTTNHVIRVLVLGDTGVGKTSLSKTLAEGAFPAAGSLHTSDELKTYQTTSSTNIQTDSATYPINITDISGVDKLEEYFKRADTVYVCFDISCPATFNQVGTKWMPKIASHRKRRKNFKILLVGLKEDLGKDAGTLRFLATEGLEPVSFKEATDLAETIGAQSYVPVSSLKYFGIQELKERTVFCNVQNSSINANENENKKCILM